MSRRAQFYLLSAVILLAITFGLFAAKEAVPKPSGAFDLIVGNYVEEAPFAANSGSIEDFTLKFYSLALETDPDFQMAYFYVTQDNISIFSLVKPAIFINQYNLSFNQSIVLPPMDSITVSAETGQYVINTTSAALRAIFISQKPGSTSVRLE